MMAQPDYTPGTWEAWVQQQAAALGLTVTSGYRTPQREAALGGPASSYHSTGSPLAPGAVDVGGPAAKLKALFDEVRAAFQGRINELYLNLPGGGSQDIKNNQAISTNPEAGRAQHLHISLGEPGSPVGSLQTPPGYNYPTDPRSGHVIDPSTGVPFSAGAPHYAASGAGEGGEDCRSAHVFGFVGPCWSDVWMYGAALMLIVGGFAMVRQGGGR